MDFERLPFDTVHVWLFLLECEKLAMKSNSHIMLSRTIISTNNQAYCCYQYVKINTREPKRVSDIIDRFFHAAVWSIVNFSWLVLLFDVKHYSQLNFACWLARWPHEPGSSLIGRLMHVQNLVAIHTTSTGWQHWYSTYIMEIIPFTESMRVLPNQEMHHE